MKRTLQILTGWFAMAIGYMSGKWLWEEVLKEKFDGLKAKLSRKD